jgi:hypothetical protein
MNDVVFVFMLFFSLLSLLFFGVAITDDRSFSKSQ